MKRALRFTVFSTTIGFSLACSDIAEKLIECADEVAAEPALDVDQEPDWSGMVYPTPAHPFLEYTSGELYVEVWDCLDSSWWADVDERKYVQVFVDTNGCFVYDTVALSEYACMSLESPEIPFRDLDGDGVSTVDGDPDDSDPSVSGPVDGDSGDSGNLND